MYYLIIIKMADVNEKRLTWPNSKKSEKVNGTCNKSDDRGNLSLSLLIHVKTSKNLLNFRNENKDQRWLCQWWKIKHIEEWWKNMGLMIFMRYVLIWIH